MQVVILTSIHSNTPSHTGLILKKSKFGAKIKKNDFSAYLSKLLPFFNTFTPFPPTEAKQPDVEAKHPDAEAWHPDVEAKHPDAEAWQPLQIN